MYKSPVTRASSCVGLLTTCSHFLLVADMNPLIIASGLVPKTLRIILVYRVPYKAIRENIKYPRSLPRHEGVYIEPLETRAPPQTRTL